MNDERNMLARHLRELLRLIEDPESDWSELRHWFRYRKWDGLDQDEISSRLQRIEHRLDSINTGRCAFAEKDRADLVVGYMTGSGGKPHDGRKHLTDWLSGATHLTVVDPYFFSFSGPNKVFRTEAQYAESIIDLTPKTLVGIEVYHLPGRNNRIFSKFKEHFRKKNIVPQCWETTAVHDRVLIKDHTAAKALGTSFGGLGNKISFVLDLPLEDLKVFRQELHRIKTPV